MEVVGGLSGFDHLRLKVGFELMSLSVEFQKYIVFLIRSNVRQIC